MPNSKELYLHLMKKILTNYIYGYAEYEEICPEGYVKNLVNKVFNKRGIKLIRLKPFNKENRSIGLGWPPFAHTMMGLKRLDNLQFCVESIITDNIPGDLVETGVWRGGGTIFMRAVLAAHEIHDRTVWVVDSFTGLPKPNSDKYPDDAGDVHYTKSELAVSLEEVKRNFEQYGLLDEQVKFLKGWFSETLPNAPIEKIAVLRMDGDMYESTMDTLINLYHKIVEDGYIIVDDFGAVPACKKAVEDFRKSNNIIEDIIQVDWTCVYWRKGNK